MRGTPLRESLRAQCLSFIITTLPVQCSIYTVPIYIQCIFFNQRLNHNLLTRRDYEQCTRKPSSYSTGFVGFCAKRSLQPLCWCVFVASLLMYRSMQDPSFLCQRVMLENPMIFSLKFAYINTTQTGTGLDRSHENYHVLMFVPLFFSSFKTNGLKPRIRMLFISNELICSHLYAL